MEHKKNNTFFYFYHGGGSLDICVLGTNVAIPSDLKLAAPSF
jgi:hypothetical protein